MRLAILELRFSDVADLWLTFWQGVDAPSRAALASSDASISAAVQLDNALYGEAVPALVPDVLLALSPASIRAIRTFAKQADRNLRDALVGHAPALVAAKCHAVSEFAQVSHIITAHGTSRPHRSCGGTRA